MASKKTIYFTSNKKSKSSITEEYEVPSYANHPFFIKKSESAKRFLEKAGLPKEYTERHKD